MQNEFCSILKSVLNYEQGQRTIVIVLVVMALIVIGVIAIKNFEKAKVSDKITICIIVVNLVVICTMYFLNHDHYQQCIINDMSTGEFVEFYGEFTHDDYQKDSFYHNVCIVDASGNKLILRYPDYSNMYKTYTDFSALPIGKFMGTIIYSKSSKIVVYWSIKTG